MRSTNDKHRICSRADRGNKEKWDEVCAALKIVMQPSVCRREQRKKCANQMDKNLQVQLFENL